MNVKKIVKDKELDMCVLEWHEEGLKSIDTDLQGIKHNMLLIDNYGAYIRKSSWLGSSLIRATISHQVPTKENENPVYSKLRDGIEQNKNFLKSCSVTPMD